ncbi:hypothetical protein D9758_006750 [Tetrapyrgos nigripes]|uniref:Poly(A) RNA polymerase mitochondrial-like central palm domain-containing protein n=1 Tax=Tetrapyrgos nigripes TaxID=182062 RepID=A0A8H5FTL2_9AGAR|nr:hypothetical protein D9758_006750 [Tetrapyrgos nigripes]
MRRVPVLRVTVTNRSQNLRADRRPLFDARKCTSRALLCKETRVHLVTDVSLNLRQCFLLQGSFATPRLSIPSRAHRLDVERPVHLLTKSPAYRYLARSPRQLSGAGIHSRRSFSTSLMCSSSKTVSKGTTLEEASAAVARKETLGRVQNAISEGFGKKYRVEIFGSIRYGVCSPRSDLDLVIIDPDRPHGIAPSALRPKLPSIYNIRKLDKLLRKQGFVDVIPIPTAKVPIGENNRTLFVSATSQPTVKFRDPKTNLDCDMNINDRLGLSNSMLIAHYCDLYPPLRLMLKTLKAWAKPLGHNSPGISDGPPTFSSYALALMTIALLQTEKALPNLQGSLPPKTNATDGQFWFRGVECDTRYDDSINRDNWNPPQDLTLSNALKRWFRFWGHDYDYKIQVVDIRLGSIPAPATRESPPEKIDSMRMLLRDPFILDKNVTGQIGHRWLKAFREDCRSVLEHIEAASNTVNREASNDIFSEQELVDDELDPRNEEASSAISSEVDDQSDPASPPMQKLDVDGEPDPTLRLIEAYTAGKKVVKFGKYKFVRTSKKSNRRKKKRR